MSWRRGRTAPVSLVLTVVTSQALTSRIVLARLDGSSETPEEELKTPPSVACGNPEKPVESSRVELGWRGGNEPREECERVSVNAFHPSTHLLSAPPPPVLSALHCR